MGTPVRAVAKARVEYTSEDFGTYGQMIILDHGDGLRTPEVVRRSGNPWFDEGVVRAIEKASPLPPPPRPSRLLLLKYRQIGLLLLLRNVPFHMHLLYARQCFHRRAFHYKCLV